MLTVYAPKLKDKWLCHYRVDKYPADEWEHLTEIGRMPHPYEVYEDEGNLLMTVGATDLFSGLAGVLGVPYTTANGQLAVGDSTTGAVASQIDLQSAVGTKLNAADPTAVSAGVPITVTATYSPTPTSGQVLVFASFAGAGAASINNTFEVTYAGGVVTLLNSVATGAITFAGATVSPINYYRQVLAAPPTVSSNTCIVTAVYTSSHANFAWNSFGLCTGAQNLNQQSQPPPHLFDRVEPAALGTKTSAAAWQLTVTLSLA